MAVYLLQIVAWTPCLHGLPWVMTGIAMIEQKISAHARKPICRGATCAPLRFATGS
jgi:hypothetical protein